MYKSIVISGQIASGTSTTAQALAKNLSLPLHSAGDFFRKYVLEHNIPLYDKEKIPDDLDRQIDKELTTLAQNGNVIIEAHYIGYFTRDLPQVLKVLLTCDYEIRIKRALARTHTHIETEDEIKKREQGLNSKFRKLYANKNYLDPKFFDLVIDTTTATTEQITDEILKGFKTNSA
ncbi:MAG: cytidylate kinase family protein [Candidatus Curtissbacteria bacterium]